ncbi:MarC family protein [Candidatus Saganbacteria bacterium]|nr:MarC family protein [Candidatus Saganbacteria bacterium]
MDLINFNWLGLAIVIIQIFIITDPVGNLPIFYALTKKENPIDRQKTFFTAAVTAFTMLIVFAFLGNAILDLFKITLADFQIAGGILILIIATLILIRGTWAEEMEHPESVGVVPIACPLLVGPGAITTAMVSMAINGIAITILAIAANFFITLVTLYFGENIFKFLGENGSAIVGKVMAIILAAIAVSFIHSGIASWMTVPVVR